MITAADVQRSFHYLYPAELPALQSLVLSLPANPLVVNIGAGAGTSGLAIMESRPDVYLVTIDITNESSPFGCLEGERQVMREAGYGDLLDVRWRQIHDDSKKVGAYWPITDLPDPDLVFIDGDHSYEGCKGDIEAWMPHLKVGGIMVVHDFLKEGIEADPDGPHPMPWPGVDQAVMELLIPNFPMIVHEKSLIAFAKVV